MNTNKQLFNATRTGVARWAPAAALALCLVQPTRSVAQGYTVTNVALPGAAGISVSGLNASGEIVGTMDTATDPSRQHAFFWANGAGYDLGTLGGTLSLGYAINNLSQVAGYAALGNDLAFHAFRGLGHTLTDLGTLGGASVGTCLSDSGHVAGYSDVGATALHAFLVPNGGAMRDLGTLGGSSSSAVAVNDAGQVAGNSMVANDADNHAFLYSGSLRDLGSLGGTYSFAFGLNASGWVVGESSTPDEAETHAFVYDGVAMRDLHTLGGTFSSAYSINNAGDIAGDSFTSSSDLHGFLYRGGQMQDLGHLGGNRSSVSQINNAGQIVGTSRNSSQEDRAFLWQSGTMRDLNTLLPANSGWELASAIFINDAGQIAGLGVYQGVQTWYVLTPRTQQNQPPVADAGPDQVVPCLETSVVVTLDGSRSSDPDGDTLQFQWFEGGASLGTGTTLSHSLALGSHLVTLRVTDPDGASADDTVTITVVDAAPPMIQCPAGQTVSAGADGLAAVPDFLSGLVVGDNGTPAGQLVKGQAPSAGTRLPCGTHTVVVTVTDLAGNSGSCPVGFVVVDTTAPTIEVSGPVQVNAGANCQATVPELSTVIGVSDNCTPASALVFSQQPAAGTVVGVGNHQVVVTVRDEAGNQSQAVVVLNVADRTAPVISSIQATPNVIRQTNRKMVPVMVTVAASDNCDANPRCRVVSVTSSEPVTGQGDNTAPDWAITGDLSVEVRAENASKDQPRVYTVQVVCTDAAGNSSTGTVTILVGK